MKFINFVIRFEELMEDDKNKISFSYIAERGKENVINSWMSHTFQASEIEVNHFRVQQYDFDGNFIKEWLDNNQLQVSSGLQERLGEMPIFQARGYKEPITVDSRYILINAIIIKFDKEGNIYVADYDGNKIVKFNFRGNVLNI